MVKIKSNYFNKKLIIISGANSGIGSEIAKQFLKYDVELVLLNKNLKINNSLQDNINNSNAKVEIFSFDFNDFYNSEELVKKIENKFKKKIDIFINCVGYNIIGYCEDIPDKDLKNIMNVNFFTPQKIVTSIIKSNKDKFTQFVFIDSNSSKKGLPANSAYCSSKAAMSVFTESLRNENKYVNILSVFPGLVDTKFGVKSLNFSNLKNTFFYGRKIQPTYLSILIIKAIILRKNYLRFSFVNILAISFSYIMPDIFDNIIKKKFRKLNGL